MRTSRRENLGEGGGEVGVIDVFPAYNGAAAGAAVVREGEDGESLHQVAACAYLHQVGRATGDAARCRAEFRRARGA